jgi:hypothetical protein
MTVVILSAIMLSVITLSAIMLSAIMLIVEAPFFNLTVIVMFEFANNKRKVLLALPSSQQGSNYKK